MAPSVDERQKLLLENLTEVRRIARGIHARLPRHVPFDDLVNEGVVGLIDAVEKYEPTKSLKLRAYARFRIRGAILDSLRKLDWGPRHLRRLARRIEQANRELAFKLGRVASEEELATRLGLPLNEFQQLRSNLDCLRIETSSEIIMKQDVVAAQKNWGAANPFDECLRVETTRALMQAIENLAEREQRALILYYFEERTMKEIGTILDVKESRVSQIISAALGRLRANSIFSFR